MVGRGNSSGSGKETMKTQQQMEDKLTGYKLQLLTFKLPLRLSNAAAYDLMSKIALLEWCLGIISSPSTI